MGAIEILYDDDSYMPVNYYERLQWTVMSPHFLTKLG